MDRRSEIDESLQSLRISVEVEYLEEALNSGIFNVNPSDIRKEVCLKIESLVEVILNYLCKGEQPVLSNRLREDVGWQTRGKKASTWVMNFDRDLPLFLHLLAKVYRLLVSGNCSTRRELYYQDVELMGNQRKVDNLIAKMSWLLGTPQWLFNVHITSKGLIHGSLTIKLGQNIINCHHKPGVLIPQDLLGVELESDARFVLLVEKDAIYQKLLDENFTHKHGPCILITGKGVPDCNTRYLLRCLWKQLKLPILGLFDSDPYGVDIMCVYRFGSKAQGHLTEELSVPSLRWIGVHPSDVEKFSIKTLPLSVRDSRKAQILLDRPCIKNRPQLYSQVKGMLESGMKAEIEGVHSIALNYLTDVYLPMKIIYKQYY